MNKLERTLLAKQHIEDVTKRFNKEISFSKENTLVYGGPDLKPEYTKDNDSGDEVLFSLEPYDTVTTLMKHCEESSKSGKRGNRVCVLNFASYKTQVVDTLVVHSHRRKRYVQNQHCFLF